MTLFFVKKDVARGLGRRMLDEDPHRLVGVSDVIVIVDKHDQWVTTKDRFDAHGQIVHPQRRAELLTNYTTISRPTNTVQPSNAE